MITSEHLPYVLERAPLWVSEVLVGIDKTSLHPARLAAILALAYLVAAYVSRDWGFLSSAWVRPFAGMGRHSLPVFCFGILLSFFARLLLEHGDGWTMQVLVNLFCFAALLGVAWMADWSRETVRPRPSAQPVMSLGNS